MERDFYMRMFLEDIEKRLVSSLIRISKNKVEIADGLVVVNCKKKVYFFQWVCSTTH